MVEAGWTPIGEYPDKLHWLSRKKAEKRRPGDVSGEGGAIFRMEMEGLKPPIYVYVLGAKAVRIDLEGLKPGNPRRTALEAEIEEAGVFE